jgi:hypothetical protein
MSIAQSTLSCKSGFCSDGESLLVQSLLYREVAAEREEILRHKWFESEKAGHDIGFENARVSWMVHHRARWRKERQQAFAKVAVEGR